MNPDIPNTPNTKIALARRMLSDAQRRLEAIHTLPEDQQDQAFLELNQELKHIEGWINKIKNTENQSD